MLLHLNAYNFCISDDSLVYWTHSYVLHAQTNLGVNPRRLEYCLIQRNGENQSLGCSVFCSVDDIWKLCFVQPSCRYFGGRVQVRPRVTYSQTQVIGSNHEFRTILQFGKDWTWAEGTGGGGQSRSQSSESLRILRWQSQSLRSPRVAPTTCSTRLLLQFTSSPCYHYAHGCHSRGKSDGNYSFLY